MGSLSPCALLARLWNVEKVKHALSNVYNSGVDARMRRVRNDEVAGNHFDKPRNFLERGHLKNYWQQHAVPSRPALG